MKRINVKRSVVLIVAILTTIVTFAQQSAREFQTQIEDLNKEMVKAMLEGNVEKSLSLYTDDAISMPSNEPIREGLAEIKKGVEEMNSSGMKVISFVPTVRKVIPDGNLVTEIGSYKIKLTVPGMDQPVEDHGKYLTLWEKQPDGSLKIKVETWNSDVNPMSQMEKKE